MKLVILAPLSFHPSPFSLGLLAKSMELIGVCAFFWNGFVETSNNDISHLGQLFHHLGWKSIVFVTAALVDLSFS